MGPHLSVAYAGSRFPREDGEFRVHSVFPSAVNLMAEGDPYPIVLLGQAGHNHPRGAILERGCDLSAWGLRTGDAAVMSGRHLRFSRPRASVADFSAAAGFEESIPRLGASIERIEAALVSLAAEQRSVGTGLRVEDLVSPRTALTRRFAQALPHLTQDFLSGAALLVGLGEGLTPSGDDFLVGWMAAARGTGLVLPELNGLKKATNVISASFLDSAERGLFPLALVELARALDGPTIGKALGTLAAVGHSSGLDSASGFLLGLRRYREERL